MLVHRFLSLRYTAQSCGSLDQGLYRILPGLVPSSPSSYSSSLSFAPCHHRVITVCIPPPLKYVIPLWNMYCRSEMCIDAPKYVLPLRNMFCHSEICYSGGMYTFANHHWESPRPLPPHERAGNGRITGSPSLCRPLTMLLPSAAVHPRMAKVLSMLKTLGWRG